MSLESASVSFHSRAGALWTIVIALDFFWLSNPLVLWTFNDSMRNAGGITLLAVILTRNRRLASPPWTVVAMTGLGLLSALWSTFSRLTIDFTLLYLAIAVVALAISTSVDGRTIAQGFLLGGVLIVVASYYTFKKGYPGAAPLGVDGYMAGVGTNRNILAYTLVLALAFALGFLPRALWARGLWMAGTGTVLLGIYLAESGTGYLAAAALVGVASTLAAMDRWHIPSSARSRRRRWTVRALVVVLFVGAFAGIDVVGRILGRDLTSLSGRVPLWKAIWVETTGLDRWVGAGWGVVWPHPWYPAAPNEAYNNIATRAGVLLTHGHNSVFDLIPELGLLGVALMAAVYAEAASRALMLRAATEAGDLRPRLEASRTALLGIVALVIFGLAEPMSTIPLGWFAITLLAAGLSPAAAPWVSDHQL